jgi:hypothetical protein
MSRIVNLYGYSYSSARVYLPETIAYLDALGIPNDSNVNIYGITNNDLWNAVDDYGIAIIGGGMFDAEWPIYLAIGGTAATHKINYTNPVDSDAAHRLSFFGGWTHDQNGMTPNGINAYANTHLNPFAKYGSDDNDAHHSEYRTNGTSTFYQHGSFSGSVSSTRNTLLEFRTTRIDARINRIGSAGLVINYSSNGRGMIIVSRNNEGDTVRAYHNGIEVGDAQVPLGASNRDYYLAARNGGTPSAYSDEVVKHFTIGRGLTAQQSLILHNAAHTLNVALNRGATL